MFGAAVLGPIFKMKFGELYDKLVKAQTKPDAKEYLTGVRGRVEKIATKHVREKVLDVLSDWTVLPKEKKQARAKKVLDEAFAEVCEGQPASRVPLLQRLRDDIVTLLNGIT